MGSQSNSNHNISASPFRHCTNKNHTTDILKRFCHHTKMNKTSNFFFLIITLFFFLRHTHTQRHKRTHPSQNKQRGNADFLPSIHFNFGSALMLLVCVFCSAREIIGRLENVHLMPSGGVFCLRAVM